MKTNKTPQQARETAERLFTDGYNCSQSVLGTFCEDLGLDFDVAMKIAQPFGAGIGRMREVCGAVSGMYMALGLTEGSDDSKDKVAKDTLYKNVQQLASTIRNKNGSIICRELLGLVPMGQSQQAVESKSKMTHVIDSPESSERTTEYYKKRPCKAFVGDIAELFQTWLNDERKEAVK